MSFICLAQRVINVDYFISKKFTTLIVLNFNSILVRNAGNLIPHAQHFHDEFFSCEPAALELGCVVNDIRHIIVCGHSDCKAMNLLYTLRNKEETSIVSDNEIMVDSLHSSGFYC